MRGPGKLPALHSHHLSASQLYTSILYAVNSPNTGPYGDAIMQELIPYLESYFRIIGEPWVGCSPAGRPAAGNRLPSRSTTRTSLAVRGRLPGSAHLFRRGGGDLYQDANVFYKQYEWRREPTLNLRTSDDEISLTSEDRNLLELVYGTHGRAGVDTTLGSRFRTDLQ